MVVVCLSEHKLFTTIISTLTSLIVGNTFHLLSHQGISVALFVLIAIVFLAWLMWSSKAQKETFLGIAWALMIFAIIAESLYQVFIH